MQLYGLCCVHCTKSFSLQIGNEKQLLSFTSWAHNEITSKVLQATEWGCLQIQYSPLPVLTIKCSIFTYGGLKWRRAMEEKCSSDRCGCCFLVPCCTHLPNIHRLKNKEYDVIFFATLQHIQIFSVFQLFILMNVKSHILKSNIIVFRIWNFTASACLVL